MKNILILIMFSFCASPFWGQTFKPFPASEIGYQVRSTNKPLIVDNSTGQKASPDFFVKLEITNEWVWFTYTDETGSRRKITYYNEASESCIASYDETGKLRFIKFQIRNYDEGNVNYCTLMIDDGKQIGLGIYIGDNLTLITD